MLIVLRHAPIQHPRTCLASLIQSDLFYLVSFIFHYPVRDPCNARHRIWRSDPTTSTGRATPTYLPLFNTSDRAMAFLATVSPLHMQMELRDATQNYVATLRGWADRLEDAKCVRPSRKRQWESTKCIRCGHCCAAGHENRDLSHPLDGGHVADRVVGAVGGRDDSELASMIFRTVKLVELGFTSWSVA